MKHGDAMGVRGEKYDAANDWNATNEGHIVQNDPTNEKVAHSALNEKVAHSAPGDYKLMSKVAETGEVMTGDEHSLVEPMTGLRIGGEDCGKALDEWEAKYHPLHFVPSLG